MKYGKWVLGGMLMILAAVNGCDFLSLWPAVQPECECELKNAVVQPGDFWTFSERRTITSEDPPAVYTTTYTRTVTDETVTDLTGQPAWIMRTEGTYGPEGGETEAFTAAEYNSQDDEGILYIHGEWVDDEEGGYMSLVRAEDGGKFRTKAYPLMVGATHEWDVTYDDGYRSWGHSSVVAIEYVVTAVGTFRAARMETEAQTSFDDWISSCTSTRWHVPEISDNVKTTVTCHEESSEGTSDYTTEYELTDSNLLSEMP